MFLSSFLISFVVFFTSILNRHGSMVAAQNCWRDTTCTGPTVEAFSGAWDKYIYSPASRTVSPTSILGPNNQFVSNFPGSATLNGNGSALIFDFGQEVGGIPTIIYSATGSGTLGLAFSEARNWTGEWSDSSNGSFQPDGAVYATITATSGANYTMPVDKIRGGFRYLTLFTVSDNAANAIDVNIQDITLEIGYAPAWSNLRAYQGYFYSNDDLINKIWYAGAFTLQTNSIPPSTGRHWPILGGSWENDQELNVGSSEPTIYVDGSKRDRTVWAGDLSIAIASILKSTGDTAGVKNTLQVLYNDQQASTGCLPFAGPGINIYTSDTYHMATLIGTYDYFMHTNDTAFLAGIWPNYEYAMAFITAKIDSTGSIYVTLDDDWGRIGQGAHNTEAQMLLYRVLTTGSQLATYYGNTTLAATWASQAVTLKAEVNAVYFDPSVGAFKNSDVDTTVYPEDANSLSLAFNVADDNKTALISQQLTTNWGPIGAVCPELPGNIVGFVQSFEVKGHLAAGQPTRALDLMRRSWGWYLNSPFGTGSTAIEGYLADGTFGYRSTTGYDNDASYTSHAHGWSTGPTDALTSYIVGLTVTSPGGSTWELAPQFGDLTHAEGGFTTPLGQFSASWTIYSTYYEVSWGVPSGTSGVLAIPGSTTNQLVSRAVPAKPTVAVNGGVIPNPDWNSTSNIVTITVGEGTGSVRVSF